LLFLLFFAAKYQSSFDLVRSPAPAIGASGATYSAKIMAILVLLTPQRERQCRGIAGGQYSRVLLTAKG
jgi:hypothetical protein